MTKSYACRLFDIEGTIAPIAFVQQVLFPYAAEHLPRFLQQHQHQQVVAALLGDVPGDTLPEKTSCLLGWITQDVKHTALKALQGQVWQTGYEQGHLQAPIYADVVTAWQQWHQHGETLAIYSSGSIQAQQYFLRYSTAGDLTPLISAYFDTTTGPKAQPASYANIALHLQFPADSIAFYSDVSAELEAAQQSGMHVFQLHRSDNSQYQRGPFPQLDQF